MDPILTIMSEANTDIQTLKKHSNNNYLKNFLKVAYNPAFKIPLPEGAPPYKPNPGNVYELRGSFWQCAKKIDALARKETPALRREVQFIQMLESLPKEEVPLLIAAKDQTLTTLFPNVTADSLKTLGLL